MNVVSTCVNHRIIGYRSWKMSTTLNSINIWSGCFVCSNFSHRIVFIQHSNNPMNSFFARCSIYVAFIHFCGIFEFSKLLINLIFFEINHFHNHTGTFLSSYRFLQWIPVLCSWRYIAPFYPQLLSAHFINSFR